MKLPSCLLPLGLRAAAASLLIATAMFAQTASPDPSAPTPGGTPPPESEVVRLNAFNVNTDQDTGYAAANTMAGGRFNTKLIATPADVSVITKAFLDDIGAITALDALKWLPNSYVNDFGNSGIDYGGNYTFRGVPSSANTRNFMLQEYTVDEYVIDRIEQVRGPASLLYGVSLSGGQANYVTKQAQFFPIDTLSVRAGSNGTTRVAIDTNVPLNDKFAVRVNAVHLRQESWVTRYLNALDAADVALKYRPWKGGEFKFEGELGYGVQSPGINPYAYYYDRFSFWDHKTVVTAPLTANLPASAGITRLTSDYLMITPSLGQGVVTNLNGFGQTQGTSLAMLSYGNPGDRPNFTENGNSESVPLLPSKNFNLWPEIDNLRNPINSLQGGFNQTWDNGLAFEGVFATNQETRYTNQNFLENTYLDVNAVLPSGAPNPNFMQVYSVNNSTTQGWAKNFDTSSHASLAYVLEEPSFQQGFYASGTTNLSEFVKHFYGYSRLNNGNPNSSTNEPNFFQYWNQPPINMSLTNYPTTDQNGNPYGWILQQNLHQQKYWDGLQVGTTGSYFHNTLTVLGGFREDFYNLKVTTFVRNATNFAPDGGAYNIGPNFNTKVHTETGGFTYFPVKIAGIYANYSTGYNPNATGYGILPTGTFKPATLSHVATGGLRFDLFQDTVTGSVGYYRSVEANRPLTNYGSAQSYINGIWTVLNNNVFDPTHDVTQGTNAYETYADVKAWGYEADFTVNVNARFRLKFNVAFPQNSQTNTATDLKAYVAEYLPTWQNFAATTTTPAYATTVNSDLANLQNVLSGAVDGRTLNSTYKWQANAFGVYTFDRGAIKGLAIGGGLNSFSKRLIGNYANQPFNFIYTSSYSVATAYLGYSAKLFGEKVDFKMNVANLLDYDKPIFYNTVVVTTTNLSQTYRDNYSYIDPRNYSFQATINF